MSWKTMLQLLIITTFLGFAAFICMLFHMGDVKAAKDFMEGAACAI